MLDEKDAEFLRKRKRFASSWNFVGSVMLLVLLAMLCWLFVRTPSLVNPYHAARLLSEGAGDRAVTGIMAGMLPIALLALFGVTGTVILYGFAVFANERRYHRIIDGLMKDAGRRGE